ncbi:terminase family protein [Bradyrhizobium sp. UNPF46]|uniref:terminase large subunit domain-containing protein n=1 Tax=Bradyrhizobium sp. UNPF46 TaxID=1141168 RepID=UPI001154C49F
MLDATTRFILFGGGAGGGKTWLYCEWLLTQCYLFPGSRWFIGRNELKRLMQSTYVTWCKVCAFHGIPKSHWTLDGKYNVIRFKNGSTIDLLDVAFKPTDPDYDRFGSTEYNGGFGEEVSEWHFKAFDVLKSRIGRHKLERDGVDITPPPKFGLSCNPSKRWPYRVFYKPWKEGTLPEQYAFIQALYSDNPHTAEEYGKQLEEISDRALKQRLKEGNWDHDEEAGMLMRHDNIRDIFTNTIVKSGEKYLIVDVARYGRDNTVFNFFDGLESYKRERYSEQGTDKTIQLIRDAAAAERIPYSHILIDEDGVGGGVVDQLTGVKGFVAASTPIPTRTMLRRQMLPTPNLTIEGKRQIAAFQHLKAQCAFKLAELVETHRLAAKPLGDEDEITDDLTQIKQRDMEKDGKLKIVPKDEVREALGRSPDTGDTFIMRMYFELLKDAAGQKNAPYERSVREMNRRAPMRQVRQRGV